MGARWDLMMQRRAKARFDTLHSIVYNMCMADLLSQHWLDNDMSDLELETHALTSLQGLPPGAEATLRVVAVQLLCEDEGYSAKDARSLVSFSTVENMLGADNAAILSAEVVRLSSSLRCEMTTLRHAASSGSYSRAMRTIAAHILPLGKRVFECGGNGNCAPSSLAFIFSNIGLLPSRDGAAAIRSLIVAEGRKSAVRCKRLANGISIEESMFISSAAWPSGGVSSADEWCRLHSYWSVIYTRWKFASILLLVRAVTRASS